MGGFAFDYRIARYVGHGCREPACLAFQYTLDIAPSLLGFATGGMAIMFAFSSGRFLKAIQQGGKDKSYLRKVIATFYHFGLVSMLSIIAAYVSKFYPYRPPVGSGGIPHFICSFACDEHCQQAMVHRADFKQSDRE